MDQEPRFLVKTSSKRNDGESSSQTNKAIQSCHW